MPRFAGSVPFERSQRTDGRTGRHDHHQIRVSGSGGEFVKIRRTLMAVAGGASGPADGRMDARAGPAQTLGHDPLSEDSVTRSRRSSVSHMRENRTYGLKGGWGNGPLAAPRP